MSDSWWLEDPNAGDRGFGIVFHRNGEQWVVHRPLLGSPAEAAGVQPGDIIHSIDQANLQETESTKLAETIQLLEVTRDHEVVFLRAQQQVLKVMRPRVLRGLLEADAALGGAAFGYCYSCGPCRSSVKGVKNCPTDSFDYTCTIG